MSDYKHIGFTKSHLEKKKYDAILKNKITNKIKLVPFGSINYQQYKDVTGLNLYTHLNHLDKRRRDNYYKRHNIDFKKYSPDFFSKKYLWPK